MATLNEQIAAALQEGYDINDIAQHLAGSENPEHQSWGQKWISTTQQPGYQAGAGIPEQPQQAAASTTPLMDFVTQNPGLAAAAGVGTVAALKAPGIYQAAQERKLANRKLDIEERRLAAYEGQVARMGTAAPQAGIPQQTPAQELSPLEQAKLETERARTEAIKQKIAMAEAKAAREEAAAKAKAEAAAAQKAAQNRQTATASGAKPSDLAMVASSEQAKIEKAIDSQQKAVAAKAAVPPTAAPVAGPVAPPTAPIVQLTPSAEVAAEAAPAAPKAAKAPKGAAVPEGMVFKEGYGPGDNWLFNTYGAAGRREILNQFNEGKPIGEYKNALEIQKKIEASRFGPELPRSVAKERGIPPPETNYGKLGKATKVAGAAGLLMTIAEAANAAQQKNYGKVADVLSDVFVLPFAQSGTAGMPQHQEEALLAEKFANAQKLGSPYRSVPPKR